MTETQTNTTTEAPARSLYFVGRKQSESIAKISSAFVKAQKKVENAEKNRANSHFGNQYATLASVFGACKDALNENGIAVMQFPADAAEGRIGLETILLHDSGEFLSGTGSFEIGRPGPQAFGSAMTYARRYFLAGMVGVCPDEDDDAEGAEGRQGGNGELPEGRQQMRGNGPAKGGSKAADL